MKRGNTISVAKNAGFKKMVEVKIAASASLPTMSFETARNYYRHLENELVTTDFESADVLSSQYKELAGIFGVKPNTDRILQKRYESSGLQCGYDRLAEYLSTLISQRKDMADPSKNFNLEQEIQRVEFCTFL